MLVNRLQFSTASTIYLLEFNVRQHILASGYMAQVAKDGWRIIKRIIVMPVNEFQVHHSDTCKYFNSAAHAVKKRNSVSIAANTSSTTVR
jgi:hypothetical protein